MWFSSPLPRARRLGAVCAVAAIPFAMSTSPAHAIDGVGGGATTSARDQYDSGPDATLPGGDGVAAAAGAGQAPAGAGAAAATPAKRPTRRPAKTPSRGSRDDGGNGVQGDGAGGDGQAPGGTGVLGDGAGGDRDGQGAGVAQDQRQLQAGGSLPFTGLSLAPVALLGAGLLAAGVALRRRSRLR